MSKSAKEPSEADIVFNRASIALAKNQRLVASWLPPRSDAELNSLKSQDDLDREEEEMFAPVPELLGVGAVVPKDKDGLPRKSEASALDKLRTQLLGKKVGASVSTPKPATGEDQIVDVQSEDEEEGRAGAISSRLKSEAESTARGDVEKAEETPHSPKVDLSAKAELADSRENSKKPKQSSRSKRSSNFMDELLQQKNKKKKHR